MCVHCPGGGGGGLLPYITYTGMCRPTASAPEEEEEEEEEEAFI